MNKAFFILWEFHVLLQCILIKFILHFSPRSSQIHPSPQSLSIYILFLKKKKKSRWNQFVLPMSVGLSTGVRLTHQGPQAGFSWKCFPASRAQLCLHWCDLIFVLKTRVENKELLPRNGTSDLSISDLGKNCDNATQYSTYFWDGEDQEVGSLDMTLMC